MLYPPLFNLISIYTVDSPFLASIITDPPHFIGQISNNR